MELKDTLEKINRLSEELEKLRPLSAENEQRVMQKFRLDWNYNSNNLEGNTLTYGETKALLLFSITAQGKPLKDHKEIEGHNEAIDYIIKVARLQEPLTEAMIRELHKMILHEPYEIEAITADGQPTRKRVEIGKYKTQPNHVKTITGEIFRFATPEETPAKMEELMKWYRENLNIKKNHPLMFAAEFHYRFIRIHPFDDGNGRIVRILMNLLLMQKGLPPVIVKTKDKENYYRALQQADSGQLEIFFNYIGEQLINSLELMVKAAIGEDIEELEDIDKEIAMLERKMETLGEDEVRVAKTEKSLRKIFSNSIIPLYEEFLKQAGKLDKFFSEVKIMILENQSIRHVSKETLIDEIQKGLSNPDNLKVLGLYYNHVSFKYAGVKDFDLSIYFQINFERYKYIIHSEPGFPAIEKLYHQILSKKEIRDIVNEKIKLHLKSIEKSIEKENKKT